MTSVKIIFVQIALNNIVLHKRCVLELFVGATVVLCSCNDYLTYFNICKGHHIL